MGLEAALYVAVSPVTLGALAVFLRSFWWAGALALALGYLGTAWAMGESAGMKALGLGLVDCRTGRAPGLRKGFMRAVLVLPPFVGAFLLADAHLGDAAGFSGQPNTQLAALCLIGAGVLSEAWALFDPHRQALYDRLCGLALVRTGRGRLGRPATRARRRETA
jgi:hypothetical protein